MELQWNQTDCTYLRQVLRECQNTEQTQEVKLPEGMPDVGRVLCAWGQPVLRSKQWRSDAVAVSGGVSAWVLYSPEDGTAPECMQVWLPFQMKWNLPDSRREGVIRVGCCLRSVDARSLSSRKLLVRASVGVILEAMEPALQPIYREGELPDGVQLLHQNYPVMLPKEAGEKLIALAEELTLPGENPGKIVCCQVYPQITEQNVVGARVVFRGSCQVQLVYMEENGKLMRHLDQIPFAQFAELDMDYDKDAEVSVAMAVSTVEPELMENKVRLRCELIGQYMIHDRELLQVVEDAYSLYQTVQPVMQELQLPVILDRARENISAQGQMQGETGKIVDVTLFAEQPVQYREENGLQSQVGGYFQVLYYDEAGMLQCKAEPWSGQWDLPVAENSQVLVWMKNMEPVQIGQGDTWETEVVLEAASLSGQPISMVSGLQLGEKTEPDPARPSLILRRAGENSLWDIAKNSGTTVDAIKKANHLTGEPALGQMLLIPIP